MSDDWQMVEEALQYALLRVGHQLGYLDDQQVYKDGKASLARLRQREAQMSASELNRRAEQRCAEAFFRAEAAEARVARLEEALREIADASPMPVTIALTALAHEEEAP